MFLEDKLQMKGSGTFVLKKADGTVEVTHKDNIIVTVGFDFIADCIGKTASRPAAMTHIAVGSGVVAAAAGNTTLGTEITRVAATYAHTAGTKVFTFTGTFAQGVGTGAITESGVLNAPSAGIMLDRVVFPVINKGADDSLDAIFTFTLS